MTSARPQATVALIPERNAPDGPLTAARLRRSLIVYLALAATGFALALTASPSWQAFGLGLAAPGGGFLAAFTSPWAALGYGAAIAATVLLFLLALFAWFGSGNVLAPIVVWLGAAIVAGLAAPAQPWQAAPLPLAALLATFAVLFVHAQRRAHREALANRARRNTHLATLAARPPAVAAAKEERAAGELTPEALGYMRYVLDRALQPVERYDGITWVDQFQFAALRYVLCAFGYGLAGIQHGSLPAFRGYLTEAQRRLHRKMLDHRNWKYWVLENAWGNLSTDPNPIHHRDNIMYHGWYAAMLAEYISNTGDARYNEQPLVLRHPDGREWRYTFSEICEVLYHSHRKSAFTLFPCEPNWIYPMCNNFSAIALKIHDRLYGTRWWAEIEPGYRRSFENEFVTADGRVLAIRSAHTGFTIAALTSAMADCVTAHYQHGTLPDIARRSWEIARLDFIRLGGDDVDITVRGWDKMDTGSYKPSMITTYAQVGTAAVEMGDHEVAERLRARVRREFAHVHEDGATRVENISSQAHAFLLPLFAQRTGARRSLHAHGTPDAQLRGPLLVDAPYPDVMVALAQSDGAALDLVLQPGRPSARGGEYVLTLGQLRPGARYRCEGAGESSFVADGSGKAGIRVRLEGRRVLRVVPQD